MFRVKQILAALTLCIISVFGYTPTVQAAQSSSTNYGVSEVNFGSGGSLQSCSTLYCSKQSAGELVVGNSSSTNFQARGGFNTNREPLLEMAVSPTPIDLGDLLPSQTKSGTTTFSVRTFPSYGYSIIVDGTSLKNKQGGHILAPMSTATTSQIGVEQFGLNLRQNTTPAIGTNVVHLPDSTFAYGVAASGYGTQNNFKYTSGDIIATSPKGTGQTDYTISVIANVSTNTPAGSYGGRLVLIAVPTF